jgi:hypothetical protein
VSSANKIDIKSEHIGISFIYSRKRSGPKNGTLRNPYQNIQQRARFATQENKLFSISLVILEPNKLNSPNSHFKEFFQQNVMIYCIKIFSKVTKNGMVCFFSFKALEMLFREWSEL